MRSFHNLFLFIPSKSSGNIFLTPRNLYKFLLDCPIYSPVTIVPDSSWSILATLFQHSANPLY